MVVSVAVAVAVAVGVGVAGLGSAAAAAAVGEGQGASEAEAVGRRFCWIHNPWSWHYWRLMVLEPRRKLRGSSSKPSIPFLRRHLFFFDPQAAQDKGIEASFSAQFLANATIADDSSER